MLDRRFIIENAELVKQNCDYRGVSADVDQLVELEMERRGLHNEIQELNRQANEVSKTIGKARDASEREAIKEEGRRLREQKDAGQEEHDLLDGRIADIQNAIPNMSHPKAPVGEDDKANLELRRGKHEPPTFDFEPLNHVQIAEQLDLIDFEGGARVAGNGFYFLKNEAVLLELALQHYALQRLIQEGFTPLTTPDLARTEILSGIGLHSQGT